MRRAHAVGRGIDLRRPDRLPRGDELAESHDASVNDRERLFVDAPPVSLEVSSWSDGTAQRYAVTWTVPDERAQRAWANPDDATEAGAYAVALASLEARFGLVALARTGRHSGSDWWIGSPTVDTELDLENAMRLEVAGMDRASDEAHVIARLSRKVEQVRKAGTGPARAVVVAFSARRVAFRDP